MRTLIVSDLHFGSASRADVLRTRHAQVALLAALSDVQRLVLLGDVLELRHGPPHVALHAARPFLRALGEKMADREIVIVYGNHDHALIDGFSQRRSEDQDPAPLGLEQRIAPDQASPMAARLAEWAAPAHVEVACPGLWVREDVYAIHGHYLDAHIAIPTLERVAVSLMGKMVDRPQAALAGVEDYEAVTAPIYAWIDTVAAQGQTRSALNGTATVRMWRMLHGSSGRGRSSAGSASENGGSRSRAVAQMRRSMLAPGLGAGLRSSAVRRGFPLAVATLNRLGLGPLQANISASELRRTALVAMGEVAAALQLGDAHVVFGHTHRAGPLPGDDLQEWRGRLGARLINTGSWTYSAGFLGQEDSDNPYWPGSCVVVEDDLTQPPRLLRLLVGSSRGQLVGSID
ncbi:MAG: metallophosphoesterase [Solirubrobacteraceae bacterium]